ncbi:MAG: V-type ATPase subunit [Oscillospiraceae bacterium]|nr:V-type ATPase subunit [Oscillospiraceae bacterium]
MPTDNYPYAVGRIRVLESGLLGDAKLARLAELPYEAARKQLADWGFAAEYPVREDVDGLIDFRRREIRDIIYELTPEPALTDLFYLEYDATNLKLLLKERLLGGGETVAAQLTPGIFDPVLLDDVTNTKDYTPLGEPLCSLMNDVEARMALQSDPRVLSAMVDDAVFQFIFSALRTHKNEFCARYFRSKADFTNILSLLRARALRFSENDLAQMLVSGGSIPSDAITACLPLEAEQLAPRLVGEDNEKAVRAALSAYAAQGVEAAAQALQRALLDVGLLEWEDPFGIGPLAAFLLRGEYECRALRRMFARKRAGATGGVTNG